VRKLIREMAPDKAILVSTHLLEEVDAICTRAVIIDRGRIVADGTPAQLLTHSRYHNAVTLILSSAQAAAARDKLAALPEVASIEDGPTETGLTTMTLFPSGGTIVVDDVSAMATREGWDVKELYAQQGRLDEVFRSMTTSDSERARERSEGVAA
jgi:ABC-2 type transport system ATP-binding protein